MLVAMGGVNCKFVFFGSEPFFFFWLVLFATSSPGILGICGLTLKFCFFQDKAGNASIF